MILCFIKIIFCSYSIVTFCVSKKVNIWQNVMFQPWVNQPGVSVVEFPPQVWEVMYLNPCHIQAVIWASLHKVLMHDTTFLRKPMTDMEWVYSDLAVHLLVICEILHINNKSVDWNAPHFKIMGRGILIYRRTNHISGKWYKNWFNR